MARLDGLRQSKRLAQTASVLGREFSFDLLARTSELQFEELLDALAIPLETELFLQEGSPPNANYFFRHSLMRDVAYQSISKRRRESIHGRVASVLTSQLPELAEARPELVAEHLSEARQFEPAAVWWMRAAERARGRAENEEAVQQARKGLAVVSNLAGETRQNRELELQLCLARTLVVARGYSQKETARAWQSAQELCSSRTEPYTLGTIRCGLANVDGNRALHGSALEGFSEVVILGDEAKDPRLRTAGLHGRGISLFCLGRFAESAEALEGAAKGLHDEVHGFVDLGLYEDCRINALCWSVLTHWYLGRSEQSLEAQARAEVLASSSPFPYDGVFARVWRALGAMLRGDLSEAAILASGGESSAQDHGFPLLRSLAFLVREYSAGIESREESASERFQRTFDASTAVNRAFISLDRSLLAQLQIVAASYSKARTNLNGALNFANQTGEKFYLAEIHRLLGRVTLAEDALAAERAEAEFRIAIGVARGQGTVFYELRAAADLARLWGEGGRRAEARELLQPVYDSFTEGFESVDLREARALLDNLA